MTMRHWRPEELWKAQGSHTLLPPSEIKVLKLHPGTPTVNHKQDSKVAEMEVNVVLQNQGLYVAPLLPCFTGEKLPVL